MSDASFSVTELRNEVLWTVAARGSLTQPQIFMAIAEIRDLKIKTRERYLRRWCSDGFLKVDKEGRFAVTTRGLEVLNRSGQTIFWLPSQREKDKQTTKKPNRHTDTHTHTESERGEEILGE